MTSLVLIFPAGSNNKNEPLDYHADILMPASTKSSGGGGRLPTLYKNFRPVPGKKIRQLTKKNNLTGLPKLTHVLYLYVILPAFISSDVKKDTI
jgi:hypothetical protein